MTAWRADMTLGQAMQVRRWEWACACVGPPIPSPPDTPCHCRLSVIQAEALHRGAHIIAKLLTDAAQRGEGGAR